MHGCRDPRCLKKGCCPLIILYNRGAVTVFVSNILHQITFVCIQICSCNLSKQLFGKIFVCHREKSPLNSGFKGLFLGIHEKGWL